MQRTMHRRFTRVMDIASLAISLGALVAVVVIKMTELIMLEEDESLQGWLRLPGTRMRYVSNSDARILKFLDEIKMAPEMKEGRGE